MKKTKEATPVPENEPIKEPMLDNAVETNEPHDGTTYETSTMDQEPLELLTKEILELKDKNLRLMAEFENYRKRSAKEKSEAYKYAGEGVLVKILPLVDDFERGIQAMKATDDGEAIKEGMLLIYSKFKSFLADNGVAVIPTENELFNTDLHEAVTTFPAPNDDLKGKIIDCVSTGYTLNEKVIRFAKVVVGE